MTQTDARWAGLVEGIGCPFCAPREDNNAFWIKVKSLTISTLYLDRNQTYRGQCLLVFDSRHAIGLESLSSREFDAFVGDLRVAAYAVSHACKPDLMNYDSLGNVIPHLHWHLVPRYESDPRWGGPIYTSTRAEMRDTRLQEDEYERIVGAIRVALLNTA